MTTRPRLLLVLTSVACRGLFAAIVAAAVILACGFGIYRRLDVGCTAVPAAVITGRVIAVDAGHGGRDPGSSSRGGLTEKEITLAIALQLSELIEQAGGTPVLTRAGDDNLHELQPGEGTLKRREIEYRLKIINGSRADVLVSIHANSIRGGVWHGAQVFYDDREGNERSQTLARVIQEELRRHTQTTRQPSNRINQYLLKHAGMPAVTVEVGFLSNPAEAAKLARPDYQEQLAWAVFSGLARYFAESPVFVQPVVRPGIGQDN